MRYLALDSEYDKTPAWEMYHLSDGTVKDSRLVNWRRVEWEKVVRIEVFIKNMKHVFDCKDKPSFLFFMRFRKLRSTTTTRYDGKGRKRIYKNPWVIGWSDGQRCYLTEIDFDTGNVIKRFTCNLQEYPSMVHPRVQGAVPHLKGMRRPIIDNASVVNMT